jgi:hypothetical protein
VHRKILSLYIQVLPFGQEDREFRSELQVSAFTMSATSINIGSEVEQCSFKLSF